MEGISSEHKNQNIVILIAILLIVLLSGYKGWQIYKGGQETETKIDANTTKFTAVPGKLISSFPKELFLENVVPNESYVLKNSNGTIQPVVNYTSKKSLAENIESYYNFLLDNNWIITQIADPAQKPVTYFYAIRGNEEVNVTFNSADAATTVNVAYLKKP